MSEFATDVDVRYTDVDTYGHVNNAVYATYLEEARIDYLEAVLGEAARGLAGVEADTSEAVDGDRAAAAGIVVANLEIDFRQPLGPVEAVTVDVWVPDLGEKSFPIEYAVRSPAGTHAEATTTMVAYDRDERRSRTIPGTWRERIADFEGR